MEKIWVMGDDFRHKSFNKYYYLQAGDEQYMKEQFEVTGFMNDKSSSLDTNTLSRFRNNFVGAVTDQPVLPKFVVIVPDNDIMKYVWYHKDDVQDGYVRLLKWLMLQYNCMVASVKEDLPTKAKKANEPIFIWIEPLQHDRIRSKENDL